MHYQIKCDTLGNTTMLISSQGVRMKEVKFYGYTIREDGTVLNKDGSTKRWSQNGRGYLISRLNIGGWRTISQHCLVAMAFLGDRPEGYEVNHKDNNKANNALSNLEYVSKRDNRLQMYKDGRDVNGTRNANSKYAEEQIVEVCKLLSSGLPTKQVALLSNVSRHTVYAILRKRQWVSVSKDFTF